MEHAELCAALAEALAQSRARYEEVRHDAFDSHVRAAEAETLEELCQSLRDGMGAEALAAQAQKTVPELEEAMQEELEHPTFDWYGEHYHYLRLKGRYAAWKTVHGLLNHGE